MQRSARKTMISVAIAGACLAGMPGWAIAAAAPPTCGRPAPVTAHQGSTTPVWLGATCQDPDLDHLTYAIVTAPAHGQLTVPDVSGEAGYTPDAGYLGADSFQFRASDGEAMSDTVTVAITVEPNLPPVCEDGSAEVEPGTPNPIWLFCFDPDSFGALTYAVVGLPQHGTAEWDPSAGLTYTPAPGYRGADSFTLSANDGLDDSNVATVTITVLGPNSAPVCTSRLSLRVAVNGSLPLDPSIACSDPDGDPIFPTLETGPRHGKLAFGDGGIVYVPDRGYAGSDRIDYRVSDPRGGRSNVAVLDIAVGDDPAPPVVTTANGRDTTGPIAGMFPEPGQRLRDVRTKGLKLIVATSEAGRLAVRLSVSRATARRLKLARRPQGPVAVGFTDRAVRAGTRTVSVSLGPKTREAFRHISRVRLLVAALVTDDAGNSTAVAQKLWLTRR